jgi:hypothetical protein
LRRSLALFAVTICMIGATGGVVASAASAAGAPAAGVSTPAFGAATKRLPGTKQIVRIGPKPANVAARNRARLQPLDEVSGPFTAQINVTYTGFPSAARNAFQKAVDTWARVIHSSVPIEVAADWADLTAAYGDERILGAAGPSQYVSGFADQPATGVYYPVALANAISGKDLLPSNFCSLQNTGTPTGAEIQATFNSNPGMSWYYGSGNGGAVPDDEVDLESVVLHELGHGFGFAGTFDGINPTTYVDDNRGYFGLSGDGKQPTVFDTFVSDKNGVKLGTAPLTNASTQLGAVLRGGSVNGAKWDGAAGKAAYGGNRVRAALFAQLLADR